MIKLDGLVSIIIPGFNEDQCIFENLLLANSIFDEMFEDFEIIFINDGSEDRTLEKAINAAEECPRIRIIDCKKNSGKGNALRIGTQESKGQYIVFMDADLELPPSQLIRFFKQMFDNNADVVIGSKMHPDSMIDFPPGRKLISFGYYFIISFLFHHKFHDTQTGLKLYKSNVLKPVMEIIQVKRFAFDIEVLSIINLRGFKIVECPIILQYNRRTKWGRIKLKDIFQVAKDTLAVYYRLYISHYYEHIE